MKTDIEYLRELEEHLMAAARREVEPAAVAAKPRPALRWRWFSTRLVAAGVAGFLAISGVIGYFATRGSPVTVTGVARSAGRALFANQPGIIHDVIGAGALKERTRHVTREARGVAEFGEERERQVAPTVGEIRRDEPVSERVQLTRHVLTLAGFQQGHAYSP